VHPPNYLRFLRYSMAEPMKTILEAALLRRMAGDMSGAMDFFSIALQNGPSLVETMANTLRYNSFLHLLSEAHRHAIHAIHARNALYSIIDFDLINDIEGIAREEVQWVSEASASQPIVNASIY
jgi:hypothetical protein